MFDIFITFAQLVLIAVTYVLIMNQVIKMHNQFKEDQEVSKTETIDEDGNLTVIEKRKYL